MQMRRWLTLLVVMTAIPAQSWAQSQNISSVKPIAAVVGRYATSQTGVGLYGTDLGIPVAYQGKLRILFGDSIKDSAGTPIDIPWGWPLGFEADDVQGYINLADFGTGAKVDAFLQTVTPAWRSRAPTMTMRLNGTKVAPIQVYDGNTTALNMGLGKVPVTAFANHKAGGGVFVVFARQQPKLCNAAGTGCGTGYDCDTAMGTCDGWAGEDAIPCVLTTGRCFCSKPAGVGGVCQDRTSSAYKNTEDGRVLSVVLKNRIGNADQSAPWDEVYWTQEFPTNKFNNITARTVRDFRADRKVGDLTNVWTPGTGAAGGNERVFMWGRPNYAGYGVHGTSAKLYFAYASMPTYHASGGFPFSVNYFTGYGAKDCTLGGADTAAGEYPCFSTNPKDARALNLGASGADKTVEVNDIVNQHTVSWVPSIGQWVMIYGGSLPDAGLEYLGGPNWTQFVRDPQGSTYIRFAPKPWGPWTAPKPLLSAGTVSPVQAGKQYAQHGTLYNPGCGGGANCAAREPLYQWYGVPDQIGRLYGAYIVDEWTMVPGANKANLYWFASTWDPYQVVLVKTEIVP